MRLNLADPKAMRLPAVLWAPMPEPDPNAPQMSPEDFAVICNALKMQADGKTMKIMHHKTELRSK